MGIVTKPNSKTILNMKKYFIASLAFMALTASCNNNTWDVTSDLTVDASDPTVGLTPLAQQQGMDNAPLYWSVYGALRQQEKDGSFPNIFTADDWDKAIEYVATNLKPYGYDMLVTDAIIPPPTPTFYTLQRTINLAGLSPTILAQNSSSRDSLSTIQTWA